jgi:hypothetical protein
MTSIATPAQRIEKAATGSGTSRQAAVAAPAARPVDSATHPPREGRWTHGQQQRAQPQQPAAGQRPRGTHRQRQLPLDGIQRGPHRILTDLPVIQGYLALAMPTAMNSCHDAPGADRAGRSTRDAA